MEFPRLYAIIDIDLLFARSLEVVPFAEELRDGGVKLLQYRNKRGSARAMLKDAEGLQNLRTGNDLKLIMNDRADLALLAGFDGVHLGQDDLPAEDGRAIIGPDRWIGVSTHKPQQVIEANETSCDYIAYGPIFSTASKSNPDPLVGIDGLRIARTLTQKPLVAIGGITLANCRAVLDAGADSVAVISSLLPTTNRPQNVRQGVEEFLKILT